MLSFCRPLPIFVEWPAEKKYTSDNIWRHGEFTISKIASDKVRRSGECSVPNHQMCRNPEHNGIIAEQPVASGSCDECIDGHKKKEVNGYNKWGSNQCDEVVKQDRRGNCQIGSQTVDLKQPAKSTAADFFVSIREGMDNCQIRLLNLNSVTGVFVHCCRNSFDSADLIIAKYASSFGAEATKIGSVLQQSGHFIFSGYDFHAATAFNM